MNRIPVFATIGGAYRFAFSRFFGNLGVVWVPVLLLAGAGWYALPRLMSGGAFPTTVTPGMSPAQMSKAMQGLLQIYRVMILFWIAIILVRAEVMLGLTQRALGIAKGPSLVYLSLGRAYWRVAGAYFAVSLILAALYIALAIAGVVIGVVAAIVIGAGTAAGATAGKAAISLTVVGLVVLLGFIIFCVLTYAIVRLTFFLTVVIVDEGRFDLIRPWRLAAGNFWRIFVVGFAVFVPVSIVIFAVYVVLELDVLRMFLAHMPPPGSADPQALGKAFQALGNGMRELLRTRWYVFAPLALVSSTLVYGLATGASVTAYRALVPAPEAEANV